MLLLYSIPYTPLCQYCFAESRGREKHLERGRILCYKYNMKRKNYLVIALIVILILVFCISAVGYKGEGAVIIEDDGDMREYFLSSKKPAYGFVFYVGTFADPRLYDAIMTKIAMAGYLVVIPYQPYNLAFNGVEAMDRVVEKYPYADFVLGGHSQGGLAATLYANSRPEAIKAIIYYASYPYYHDLKKHDFPVLTIIPSNDEVVSLDDMFNSPNYPNDTEFFVIEGGNHISFADGLIFPDGELEIAKEEQQNITAQKTIEFLDRVFYG